MANLCYDKFSDRIVFILAKPILTTLKPDTVPICMDDCDQVIFGFKNIKTNELFSRISRHQLGIYSESFNTYCLIDKIITTDSGNDGLLFYCGTGENWGLTKWLFYEFNNDNLKIVQKMNNLVPETFDVKDEKLLKLFEYKSNSDISTKPKPNIPATSDPTSKGVRQQAGSISVLVPDGYVLREHIAPKLINLLLGGYENLIDSWLVVTTEISNEYDSFYLEGKISTESEEEAELRMKKTLQTSMLIEIREEKNPQQLDLKTWTEKYYGGWLKTIEGDVIVSSDSRIIAGKTALVLSLKNVDVKTGRLINIYICQPLPEHNVVTIFSYELIDRPVKNQIEDFLRSIM